MPVPSTPILAAALPAVIRRAKKTKWCAECRRRIPAGTLYIECSPWRWTHMGDCPEGEVPA